MNLKQLQTNFERELLFQIIYNMRHKTLTKDRARKVSAEFLQTLKSDEVNIFIEKIARLCEFYPEIREAFLITVKEYEIQTSGLSLENVRDEFRKSNTSSLKASVIIHARFEERLMADTSDSKTQNFRQDSLMGGGE